MKEMILKLRLSGIIGMLFGGLFLAWLGFSCATMIIDFSGSKSITAIPAIFSILGLRWVVIAVAMLLNRTQLSIRSIELPTGAAYRPNAPKQVIPRSEILEVSKHAYRRGRGIKIARTDGTATFVDIRRYCNIKKFLTLCSEMSLPVA